MNKLTVLSLLGLLYIASFATPSFADDPVCGVTPSLPTTKETDESLKGELKGQADLLTKFVGKAELGGQIEAAKKSLYQNSDQFFAAQKDAYLAYVFCAIVMQDKQFSTKDKLDALQKYRDTTPPKPAGSSYDWRKDAGQFSYIYSGKAYCDKYKKTTDVQCINTTVGNFTLNDRSAEYYNVVTITEKAISVHTMEFSKGVLRSDLREEANIVDLNEISTYWTGNYYDGTSDDSLTLNCIAGECIRWTGWKFVSDRPGESHKESYSNTPVIDYIKIPLAKNVDSDLIFDMRRILARIITIDHSDVGTTACKLLCSRESCPWITDDCAKYAYH